MKTLALLAALIICSLTFGQPQIEWIREFDLGDYDNVWDIIQVDDGYVFACSREVRSDQSDDTLGFWIIRKLDLNGDTLWLHEYQSSGRGLRLLAKAGGGYSIAGLWTIIINIDQNGDSVSSAHYLPQPPTGVGAWSLAPSHDNEWLFWADPNINQGHYLVSKVSPQGNIRWEVPYAYQNVYTPGTFGMAPGGGTTVSYRVSQDDYSLDYIDSNGELQWSLDLDAHGLNGYNTRLLANSQILVINSYLTRATLVNLNGGIIWNRNYGDGEYRSYARPDITDIGESVMGVNDPDSQYYQNRIFVTASNGDSLWSFQLPDSLRGPLELCRFTRDDGVLLGVNPWNGTGPNEIVRIIKIAAPVGTGAHRNANFLFPENLKFVTYPNPFNPSTTISFALDKPEHAQIVVFDLNGREVTTLANERFERGEHSLNFDGGAFPSGIYFAHLQTESGLARTVKMALVK